MRQGRSVYKVIVYYKAEKGDPAPLPECFNFETKSAAEIFYLRQLNKPSVITAERKME